MTVAAPALPSAASRPSRLGGFDPTWLLWLAIIAVLLFLVVSPFVYLVLTSFQNEKTGAFTFANYGTAYGRQRYVDALFNSLQLGAGAALLAGVFAVPLAWAVSRTDMPGRGFVRMLVLGDLHHAALHRRRRLDPAGRAERRLAQPHLCDADRRGGGAVQHLQLSRPRRRHRALFLPLHLHLHQRRRSSWCRPRWRMPPTSWAPAPGARCARSPCRWRCRRSWAA